MYDYFLAIACNLPINLIFDHTSWFYHLPSATFICSSDVTNVLANSFPSVKLPLVGHFSCSYFELNYIENHSLSLPTLSMNAVFSYELYRGNLFLRSFIWKCLSMELFFPHPDIRSNQSRICFLWVSSNISSLGVHFASLHVWQGGTWLTIHQSHSLQCFQCLITWLD